MPNISLYASTSVKASDIAEFNPAEFNPAEFNCYNVITNGVTEMKANPNTFQIYAAKSSFDLVPS